MKEVYSIIWVISLTPRPIAIFFNLYKINVEYDSTEADPDFVKEVWGTKKHEINATTFGARVWRFDLAKH